MKPYESGLAFLLHSSAVSRQAVVGEDPVVLGPRLGSLAELLRWFAHAKVPIVAKRSPK